jgi:hypothetical protein
VPGWVIVGLMGLASSAALLVTGVVLRRSHSTSTSWTGLGALLLGVLGIVVSAGWLILVAYAEAPGLQL